MGALAGSSRAVIFGSFPGHALHEKGLQKQIGVGTLVSNQDEGRPSSWSLTGCQPRVLYPKRLNRISLVRASRDTLRSVRGLRCLGDKRVGCFLGKPCRRRPVLPIPAPPRHPAVCCLVPTRPWHARVLDSTSEVSKARLEVVVGPFEVPLVGYPFARSPTIVICDNLGVKTASCVVLVWVEDAPVVCCVTAGTFVPQRRRPGHLRSSWFHKWILLTNRAVACSFA